MAPNPDKERNMNIQEHRSGSDASHDLNTGSSNIRGENQQGSCNVNTGSGSSNVLGENQQHVSYDVTTERRSSSNVVGEGHIATGRGSSNVVSEGEMFARRGSSNVVGQGQISTGKGSSNLVGQGQQHASCDVITGSSNVSGESQHTNSEDNRRNGSTNVTKDVPTEASNAEHDNASDSNSVPESGKDDASPVNLPVMVVCPRCNKRFR